MKTRFLSSLLVCMMLLSLMPTSVLAAEAGGGTGEQSAASDVGDTAVTEISEFTESSEDESVGDESETTIFNVVETVGSKDDCITYSDAVVQISTTPGTYVISLQEDISASEGLNVGDGQEITILGNDHTITYSYSGNVTAFYIAGGTLNLGAEDDSDNTLSLTTDANISGQREPYVYINYGKLNMYDGVTMSNRLNSSSSCGGGAVTLGYLGPTAASNRGDSIFNMYGGVIENCTGMHGGNVAGAVYISNTKAVFNMYGGTIRNCLSTCGGTGGSGYTLCGGGVYNRQGTFIMSGGSIENCTADQTKDVKSYGGGVYSYGGTFEMSGGTISACSANFGGGVYSYGGTCTVTGGNISNCSAENNGGGFYLYPTANSTYTLNNSIIKTCSAGEAGYGGGIYYYGYYDTIGLTVSDCTISGCSAYYGGGIHNYYGGKLVIEGGAITDNSAVCGGGIFNYFKTTTTVNGPIYVNSASDCGDDIYDYYSEKYPSKLTICRFPAGYMLADGLEIDGWYEDGEVNYSDDNNPEVYYRWGNTLGVDIDGSYYNQSVNLRSGDAYYFELPLGTYESSVALKAAHGLFHTVSVRYVDEIGNSVCEVENDSVIRLGHGESYNVQDSAMAGIPAGWTYKELAENSAPLSGTVDSDKDVVVVVYKTTTIDPIYYTLRYKSNGGTDYDDESYTAETIVNLDKEPTRESYEFTGWYADEALTEKITDIKMTSDKTVYAGWSKKSGGNSEDKTTYYTLHYESNGGTEYDDERYAAGTVVSLNKVPTREGYVFTGWYADEALTEKITSIKMTSSKTIYAGWRASTVPDMLNGDNHFAYVIGYTDGTVRPLANISRAEVATIFFRLLTAEVRDGNLTSTNTFEDVTGGMWCNTPISTMAALGIVKGRSAEAFDPDAPITRAEFAAICARFDTGLTSGSSDFTDISGHWAEEEIKRAASLGWIMGYPDGTFRPDQYITRAEAMTIINRVLCRIPEDESDLLDGMNVWPDNAPGEWYYLAVQEATNSHEYVHKGEIYETWIELTEDPDWKRYEN